jgi:PAS domain S-box-containing protein
MQSMPREFLWAVLDQLPHAAFVKDREFKYVFMNRAALAVIDQKLEHMLGKTDYEVLPRAKADFYRDKDVELFRTGVIVQVDEELFTDAAGRRRVLATTKTPLRNEAGEITHLIGVIQDITLLKAAQEALSAANEALEERVQQRTQELANAQQELLRKERLAVLGRLVGSLAHQIRNPLGAIINATSILSRALPADVQSDVTQSLAVIHDESWRANRIIVDLLDYARVRPAEPKPLPIETLVNHVLLGEEIPDSIQIKRDLEPALAALADHDQSEGALRNLVRNAVEAMPTGGTLSLAARRDGEQVVIWVSDTGPGVSREVRKQLFDPLVTTKTLGLGLGLSTARALVENQRGSLSYVDVSGGGARFEIRLRRAEAR